MNVCHFKGCLTRDIELKKTKNSNSVVNFSIAVKHFIKDAAPEVNYFDIEAWGPVAELLAEGGYKGRHVIIMGQAKNHSWQTKDDNGQDVTRKAIRFRATGFEWCSFDPAKAKKVEQDEQDDLVSNVANATNDEDDFPVNF